MKYSYFILLAITAACNDMQPAATAPEKIKLVTLEPGHFHAALVQKSMYPALDSTVYVYAPEGNELKAHLALIDQYNSRTDNPTHWNEVVYSGADYADKMLQDKAGSVVVLAGNNQKKTGYISKAVNAGFHVLADKPMAIDKNSFDVLEKAFATAAEKKRLLYDIMTERYEITTMLQREFSLVPEVFGTLEKGTPENPAVTKESVHHFYKYVSGKVLTRPAWFFDVLQEGEGIVDVTTHLVDLVQWECFPGQTIDYKKDIVLGSARRWSTDLTPGQFKAITKQDSFPAYLAKDLRKDSILSVYSNGEINYRLKDVCAKVSVKWNYQAPEGTGDTHYSIMRGTRSNLVIRQGAEQQYKPALYIEPIDAKDSLFEKNLLDKLKNIQAKFPGVELQKQQKGWQVIIPEKYKEGHEAHFSRVTEKFIEYLQKGNMPAWEVPNMLAKYYTTTAARELALKNNR